MKYVLKVSMRVVAFARLLSALTSFSVRWESSGCICHVRVAVLNANVVKPKIHENPGSRGRQGFHGCWGEPLCFSGKR